LSHRRLDPEVACAVLKGVVMENKDKLNYIYVGLDLHKEIHVAVAIDCFSEVLKTITIENKPAEFDTLVKEMESVAGDKGIIFGLEDVGGNGRSLALYLKQKEYITKEVNAALAEGYRSGDVQYKKNDEHDAKCVAEVLLHRINKLPDANPQDLFWTLTQIVKNRRILVKAQTVAKIKLNEQLKHHYPSYKKFFSKIDGKGALYFWDTYPSPRCLEGVSVEELTINLRGASRNACSTKKAKTILELVATDGKTTEGFQEQRDELVRSHIRKIKFLNEEIKTHEAELEAMQHHFNHQLQTIPGISLVMASEIIAEIGDINRFSSPAKLAKFAGIAPISFGSAGKGTTTKNKQGNRKLNGIFFLLAMQSVQIHGEKARNPAFYNYYQKKLSEGKCKKQAMIAVMRRLVNIVYGMLKNGSEYRMPKVELITAKEHLERVA